MIIRDFNLFLLVPMLIAAGGCTDQDVSRKPFQVRSGTAGSGEGVISLSMDLLGDREGPPLRLVLNDRPAVIGSGESVEYVPVGLQSGVAMVTPIGGYVVTLEDSDGNVAVTSDAIEVIEGQETMIVVHGPRRALKTRTLTPDLPETDGDGNYLLRTLNVMNSGEAFDVVSCPAAGPCATVHAGLAYGEMFEQAVPAGSTGELLFTACRPGEVAGDDCRFPLSAIAQPASRPRSRAVLVGSRNSFSFFPLLAE